MSASTGAMMDDPSNLIPGGTAGLFGAFGAAIIGGVLWLRQFLSKDSVDRSADAAQKGVIDMLNAQLSSERARADKLMGALDDATTQLNALRGQVSDLTEQVRILQRQIANMAHKP